ncbi:MAG: hypothetical protein K2I78_05270, partial [Clostridia bacterium]|nr:hypothetical protein [Clostridia bacterium]
AEAGVVTIKYCAQGSEVNSHLIAARDMGEEAYGIYAEPDVSKGINEELTEVFDLQELWAEYAVDGYSGYAQAVLIAKSSVCEDNEFVVKLLEELDNNKSQILKDAQLAENNIKSIYPQTALQGNLNADVIARCNINAVSMENGREYYEKTLKAVMDINSKLIGGQLPGDEFYCVVNR